MNQILDLINDNVITSYFENKDIKKFIHKYIEIDTILNNDKKINSCTSPPHDIPCDILCNNLYDLCNNIFLDSEITLTNNKDILIEKKDKKNIIIRSINTKKAINKIQIDEFYNYINENDYNGILCNAIGGIVDKNNLSIDTIDNNNIVLFIHKHNFDENYFKIAIDIIYNMYYIIKEKKHDEITIDQLLFNNLKREYNYFLQTYEYHLDIVKSNTESLYNLKLNLLDNFFKRKILNNSNKLFSCHLCGTGFTTDKALKRHFKNQHQSKNKKPDNDNNEQYDIENDDDNLLSEDKNNYKIEF
jgi:hypothetical protein